MEPIPPSLEPAPAPVPATLAPVPAPAPRPPPRARWLVIWYLAVNLAVTPLAGKVGVLGAIVLAQLSAALPALVWAARSGFAPLRLLRLGPASGTALLVGAGTGLSCILAGAGLQSLWISLLPASLTARFDLARRLVGLDPWVLLPAVALLPALCEELAFRGALLSALAGRRSPARAILGSALLFTAFHVDPVRLPGVLMIGLAFGWLAWRTGSIWPSAVAHAVNNGAAVLVVGLGGGAEAADPTDSLPAAVAATVLVAGAGAFTLLLRAARRRLPPAPGAASFLVPRVAAPPAPTTAGAAPSP